MDYVAEFLRHSRDVRRIRHISEATYREKLAIFSTFMRENYPDTILKDTTTEQVIHYRNYLEQRFNTHDAVADRLTITRIMFNWMLDAGHIERSPFPRRMVVSIGSQPVYVPTHNHILLMRSKRGADLKLALAFEIMLCTGLRLGEFLQIRLCDINLSDMPIDSVTGLPTSCFAGSITISGKRSILKSRGRKLYLSYIARRVLKIYLDRYKLTDLTSAVPLFPWKRSSIQSGMRAIGEGIANLDYLSECKARTDGVDRRSTGFLDVDTSKVKAASEFLKQIKQRQDDASKRKVSGKQDDEPEVRERKILMHAHALRHAYICAMWFMNYWGEHHAEDRLRTLAGHGGADTTLTYLQNFDFISTEDEWKRLWIGKPIDWMGMKS